MQSYVNPMNPNSKRLPQGQHLYICADAAFLYIQDRCPAGTFEPAENDAEYAQHEYDIQQEEANLLRKAAASSEVLIQHVSSQQVYLNPLRIYEAVPGLFLISVSVCAFPFLP